MSGPFPPFGSTTVVPVDPGTEITDPVTGEKATVTDEEAIRLDGTIYVTPKQFEAIKARTVPVEEVSQ